jgi:hypothetical protein
LHARSELLDDFLSQQTCWIGEASREGPAHQCDSDWRNGGKLM